MSSGRGVGGCALDIVHEMYLVHGYMSDVVESEMVLVLPSRNTVVCSGILSVI